MKSTVAPPKNPDEVEKEISANSYEFLFRAKAGEKIIVRDDQYNFSLLLDAARSCRKNNSRLSLIDSGKYDVFELEWLAEAGADIYTSDRARKNHQELILLNKAVSKRKGSVAYAHYGTLEQKSGAQTISFSDLKEMAGSGIFLHFSNKEKEHEFLKLRELARECCRAKSWLIYYHHRLLEPALEDLAQNGAWIHVSDYSLAKDEDISLLINFIQAARSKEANLILHVEKGLNVLWLKDIFREGAFVIFHTPPSDFRSSLRTFELRAEKQKLDYRACYIYANFLL